MSAHAEESNSPAQCRPPRGRGFGFLILGLVLPFSCGGSTEGSIAPSTSPRPNLAEQTPGGAEHQATSAPEVLTVEVLRSLPHDPTAYTQGLLISGDQVYESRGQYGFSGIDIWDPETGHVVRSVELPDHLFGEGLARVGNWLWQLTWQAGRALRWNAQTLTLDGGGHDDGEGWGLTFDGRRLIMSDGTQELRFLDPTSFEELGRLSVTRGSRPQDLLNELEWVEDEQALYANLYQTDEIVRIDARTGVVTAVADLSELLSQSERQRADVLNGIAYWPSRNSFLVTGKHWPKSFEIRFQSDKARVPGDQH